MNRPISRMRHIFFLLWSVIIALLLILSACGPAPTPTPTPTSTPTPVPGAFIGVNMRELAYLYVNDPNAYDSGGVVQQQLETASDMGATVIRVYLSSEVGNGTYRASTSEVIPALNDLFAFTKELKDQDRINPNMKYILVLTDFYQGESFSDLKEEYFQDGHLSDEWFRTYYKGQVGNNNYPFGSYPSFYEYAKAMINTLSDPTLIYAWELGNEFQAASEQDMVNFITDVGCKIRDEVADTDILFTSGFISAYHATRGARNTAQALYSITCNGEPVFDFATIHGYNNQWDPSYPIDDPVGAPPPDKLYQLEDVVWFNDSNMPYVFEEMSFTGAYDGADSTPPPTCGDGSFPLDTTAETDRSTFIRSTLDDFLGSQQATGVMQWAFRAGPGAGDLGDSCRGMDSNPHLDWDNMFEVYCNKAMELDSSLGLNCSTQTSGIDVVIVMDTTGSMVPGIAAAKSVAINYIDQLADSGIDYRAAVVDYRDKRYDPYASRLDLAFTTDRTAISNAINALSASGGGDIPEDVYSGLMTAINLPWRNGSKKVIILMGDAGPLDPEPGTNYTLRSVINAANAVDPASIYAIRIGYNTSMRSTFQQLADGTGGMTFDASNTTSSVSTAILNALNSVAHSPSAVIGENNGQIVGSIGTPIHFDASHSFDVDGTIVQYDWDFNNDGLFDLNSPDPTADYTYTQAYNGLVTLRVHDNDGNTNKVSVKIMVDATGNDTTPPVINITSPLPQAYLHTDSVNISWTATDTGSGIASNTGTLDSTAVTNGQTFDLFFLGLGSHTLLVTATDNAGNTATTSVTFTIVADINSLIAMEQRACSLGWISGDGVCNSLEAKLLAAKASIDRGRFNTAKNQLNAFIAELDAQKDKKVTQGYDVLKADAIYVVNSLP